MAIELLPIEELKKKVEVPVDFSAIIKKAAKYDIKAKKRQEIILPTSLV